MSTGYNKRNWSICRCPCHFVVPTEKNNVSLFCYTKYAQALLWHWLTLSHAGPMLYMLSLFRLFSPELDFWPKLSKNVNEYMKSCKLRCPKVKLLTRLQEYLLSSDIRIFTGICLAIHYSALINRYSNTINHYKGRVRVWLDHSLAVQRSQTGRIVQKKDH